MLQDLKFLLQNECIENDLYRLTPKWHKIVINSFCFFNSQHKQNYDLFAQVCITTICLWWFWLIACLWFCTQLMMQCLTQPRPPPGMGNTCRASLAADTGNRRRCHPKGSWLQDSWNCGKDVGARPPSCVKAGMRSGTDGIGWDMGFTSCKALPALRGSLVIWRLSPCHHRRPGDPHLRASEGRKQTATTATSSRFINITLWLFM